MKMWNVSWNHELNMKNTKTRTIWKIRYFCSSLLEVITPDKRIDCFEQRFNLWQYQMTCQRYWQNHHSFICAQAHSEEVWHVDQYSKTDKAIKRAKVLSINKMCTCSQQPESDKFSWSFSLASVEQKEEQVSFSPSLCWGQIMMTSLSGIQHS